MYQYSPGHYHQHRSNFGHSPTKRRVRWLQWLIVIFVLFSLAVAWLFVLPYLVIQNYYTFNGTVVAKVSINTTRVPHLMHVHIDVLNKAHNLVQSNDCYIKQGDTMAFQGDTLTFASWLNAFSSNSSIKLTRFSHCYNDTQLTDALNSDLNGGDDGYFSAAMKQSWLFPTVQAHYSPSTFLLANFLVNQKSHTYLLVASPTKLQLIPSN